MHGRKHIRFLLAFLSVAGAGWTCLAGDSPRSVETTSDAELRQSVAADVAALTKSRFSSGGRNDEALLQFLAATRFHLWQQAANKGLPEGLTLYGLCFDYGIVVTNDTTAAMSCYRRAADAGYAPAQFELGGCYSSPHRVGTKRPARGTDFALLKFDPHVTAIVVAGITEDPPGTRSKPTRFVLTYFRATSIPKRKGWRLNGWKNSNVDQGVTSRRAPNNRNCTVQGRVSFFPMTGTSSHVPTWSMVAGRS